MNVAVTIQSNDLHGEIVTWDLNAPDGVSVVSLRDALTQSNLPPELCRDLSARSAFSRVCGELKTARSIDKVESRGGITRFQFTAKTLENHAINFRREAVVELNTLTGAISCKENRDLEQLAIRTFDAAMDNRTTQDVTRLVQKLFAEQADLFAINPRKGVAYFVPEVYRDFTGRIEDLLTRLGGALYRFPVPKGTPTGDRAVQAAVESGLQALSDELLASVEEWDLTTRDKTIDKAVESWRKINFKVEAYSDFLSVKQANLQSNLADVRKRIAEKVSAISAGVVDRMETTA